MLNVHFMSTSVVNTLGKSHLPSQQPYEADFVIILWVYK